LSTPRRSRSAKKGAAAAGAAVVVVIIAFIVPVPAEDPAPSPAPTVSASPTASPTPNPSPSPVSYPVERVVDGDTVRITRDGKSVPLRLIGGDTPETVHPTQPVECYGPEASAEAKELLEGQRVQVVYDPTQGTPTGDGRYVDYFDRELVYLTLPDGRDYMEHMISEGFAAEYRYRSDYQRMDTYRAAQKQAKEAGAGLWSACA